MRASAIVVALAALVIAHVRWGRPRPAPLPLIAVVDGPAPANASGVLVFLHGLGNGIPRSRGLIERLRGAGLPADYAIVLIEAPFSTGFGHSWGGTTDEQRSSRARVRARLAELIGDAKPRVVLVGFSQGAGMAIDTAVEEPRITHLASIAPCFSWLRGALPAREGLKIFLAHGARDKTCPVIESRSLAKVLADAGKPAEYLEIEGGHTITSDEVRAIVAFATRP